MAQLPKSCTSCESPVEYHCNICGNDFCPGCKDNHLKTSANKHHDVVPYTQRNKPDKSSLLQCGDHPGQQCGVWCQTCKRAVCGDCVTSPKHRDHHFLKYDEKIEERRKEIEGEFGRYAKILCDWQTSLEEADKLTEAYNKAVKQLDREIADRAEEICEQVRMVEKQNRRRLQDMKDASLTILQDQQKMLTDGVQRLKKKIKELEDKLRSNDSLTILEYSSENDIVADTKTYLSHHPALPVFAAGPLDVDVLKDMFGSLSEAGVQDALSELPQSKQMTLLTKLSVASVINIEMGWYAPAIAYVGSGQAWVRTEPGELQLLNRKGTAKATVKIKFDIRDMAVTPQGDILLPDYDNKCIRSMSMEGDIKILFSTTWGPYGLCCLPSRNIVVAFIDAKRVVQYSCTGKIIREMDKSLFQYPWYVAYSQVNKQLYVTDKSKPIAYYATGRVLSLDMNGRLQYTYTGSDTTTFTPVAVCTDLSGHVFITDYNNNTVHILDKGGNLLQYIMTSNLGGTFLQYLTGKQELTKPATIDIDNEGYAWIGEYGTGRVKVVKYTDMKQSE